MSETADDLNSDAPVKEFKELLTFFLAGEEYGVDILRVQEIKGWDSVTNIPNTPEYIRGVINIRGAIVPIIDMRLRFMLEKKEYDATTVVIILNVVNKGSTDRVMGVVVDAVSDVYKFSDSEIKPSPDFGTEIDSKFIAGMATIDDKIIVILDAIKLLDVKELYQLTESINKMAS